MGCFSASFQHRATCQLRSEWLKWSHGKGPRNRPTRPTLEISPPESNLVLSTTMSSKQPPYKNSVLTRLISFWEGRSGHSAHSPDGDQSCQSHPPFSLISALHLEGLGTDKGRGSEKLIKGGHTSHRSLRIQAALTLNLICNSCSCLPTLNGNFCPITPVLQETFGKILLWGFPLGPALPSQHFPFIQDK